MQIVPQKKGYISVTLIIIAPFTGRFSNSTYESLSKLYNLKEILISEGLMDKKGNIIRKSRDRVSI